jgi:UDP-hydrolysing UDP-N-acetyl-D-glucosamine 2-epimerase
MAVTGSRAEFGLLRPVFDAIAAHDELGLHVVVAGAHLLPPAETWREVGDRYDVRATVRMQRDDETGHAADAAALGRGVTGFAEAIADIEPAWVLLLGDRVEAFAAAAAAAIAGVPVAHIHGGDRAEGVVDESMRHAISKLAHLHLAASVSSAERLVRMGEEPGRVHVVGSPAADGVRDVKPRVLDELDETFTVLVQLHPCGLSHDEERGWAEATMSAVRATLRQDERAAVLEPNHDPGCEAMRAALSRSVETDERLAMIGHSPHAWFRGQLRWLGEHGGAMVGNSSAGLIEAPMLGCPSVNVGPRQAGRETPRGVLTVEHRDADEIAAAISAARTVDVDPSDHPYGDGRAGERIAALLADATLDPSSPTLLRKRNTY